MVWQGKALPDLFSGLYTECRIREREAEVIDRAQGHLLKSESLVKADGLFVFGIDLKGPFALPGQGIGDKRAPDTATLPARRDEYPANETSQKADEANNFSA